MKKLLIDTSVIIDFLRRKDKKDSLLRKISEQDLYISIVTHTELYSGKSVWESKAAKQELKKLFSIFTILPLITEISQNAGKIKAYNHDMTIIDCIIAATSIIRDLDLTTLNIKDFEKVDSIKLFKN